jgi:uncharacterized protein
VTGTGAAAETYEKLRERVLTLRSADLGLARAAGRPAWGVVMEVGSTAGVTTVVATDDGAARLFASGGGDAVHLAKPDWPHQAGGRFIGAAGDCLFACSPAWAHPSPEPGMIRFYLLTFDGVLTAQAPADELAAGSAPLSALFYAGHDVLVLARLVSEEPDWAAYGAAGAPAESGLHEDGDQPGDEAPSQGVAREPAAPPQDEAPTEAPAHDLLLRAAAKNDVDEVASLLAKGHDLAPNAKGLTPLMAAAHAGALEPLRLLLAAGAPVDVHGSHGFTALMFACNAGHVVCARLLLGAGADVRERDGEGSTPVMFAAQHGYDDIVRLLMERGVDPSEVNGRGLSAVGLATQKGHTETVAILLGTAG